DGATAAALQELNRLPGVQAVAGERDQVAVRGTRGVVAHIGAWLVARPEAIPADLRVDIPDLETALLTLLDNPDPEQGDQTPMGAASSPARPRPCRPRRTPLPAVRHPPADASAQWAAGCSRASFGCSPGTRSRSPSSSGSRSWRC